eukprot:scaffold191706_cov30-Tisochrysis_lutea.AAC.2
MSSDACCFCLAPFLGLLKWPRVELSVGYRYPISDNRALIDMHAFVARRLSPELPNFYVQSPHLCRTLRAANHSGLSHRHFDGRYSRGADD